MADSCWLRTDHSCARIFGLKSAELLFGLACYFTVFLLCHMEGVIIFFQVNNQPERETKSLRLVKSLRLASLLLAVLLLGSCSYTAEQGGNKKPYQASKPYQKPHQARSLTQPKDEREPHGFKQHAHQHDVSEQPYALQQWLLVSNWRQQQATSYARFLQSQAGYMPPLEQMLRSARSWQDCGFDPYEIPPSEYWSNMVPTLKLVKLLQEQDVLPTDLEVVSVYRNPELNACANGSAGSKHLLNAAVDIAIDYGDEFERLITEQKLCKFWLNEGQYYEFGLGLYKSGAIHIDTQGYRSWGSSHSSGSSPCRFD